MTKISDMTPGERRDLRLRAEAEDPPGARASVLRLRAWLAEHGIADCTCAYTISDDGQGYRLSTVGSAGPCRHHPAEVAPFGELFAYQFSRPTHEARCTSFPCDWPGVRSDDLSAYGRAREHTEQTGHVTEVDRIERTQYSWVTPAGDPA